MEVGIEALVVLGMAGRCSSLGSFVPDLLCCRYTWFGFPMPLVWSLYVALRVAGCSVV